MAMSCRHWVICEATQSKNRAAAFGLVLWSGTHFRRVAAACMERKVSYHLEQSKSRVFSMCRLISTCVGRDGGGEKEN